jgi:hypothetical protein
MRKQLVHGSLTNDSQNVKVETDGLRQGSGLSQDVARLTMFFQRQKNMPAAHRGPFAGFGSE